jgi:hypothetical protein
MSELADAIVKRAVADAGVPRETPGDRLEAMRLADPEGYAALPSGIRLAHAIQKQRQAETAGDGGSEE